MGTSLTVQPFSLLANMAPEGCPRVLVNMELVGNIGNRSDDIILLGKSDDIIQDLCKELGWEEELLKTWKSTKRAKSAGSKSTPTETSSATKVKNQQSEVDELTHAIEASLFVTGDPKLAEKTESDKPPEASASAKARNADGVLEIMLAKKDSYTEGKL